MLRTKPWPKTPPGNLSQSSSSNAWRNRLLMRVALLSSSMVTSRISRSRFRRSPKFPLAMNPDLSLVIEGGRAQVRRGIPPRTIGGGIRYCQTSDLERLWKARQVQASERWRNGNACTTSVLRTFLRGAYTDNDSLVWRESGGFVFLAVDEDLLISTVARLSSVTAWKTREECR